MTRDDCIFCRIVRGEIPSHKIFEDDETLAILDKYPLAIGHTLVIPKEHIARVEGLNSEVSKLLFSTVQRLLGPILRSVGAPASTIGINDGHEAGQVVPHVHIHIIPRFGGDEGGTIHSIMTRRPHLDDTGIAKVAEKILNEVSKQGRIQDVT